MSYCVCIVCVLGKVLTSSGGGENKAVGRTTCTEKDEGVLTGTLDHVEQEQVSNIFFPSFEWNTTL